MDELLRGQDERGLLRNRLLTILVAGSFYGAVMGAYGGITPDRWMQIAYSAVKVPLLLVATFCLSVPSFFVLNTLIGLREDFGRALAALAGAQAVLTLILASLAPITIVWYVSGLGYANAILFNAFMFAVASIGGQLDLRRSYRALAQRRRGHKWMQPVWLVIYAFVGIQMGWVMRPFIGNPDLPTGFLRTGAMSNAYVVVAHMVLGKF
jgi:hypothetical protein